MPKAIKKKIKKKDIGTEEEVKDRLSNITARFRKRQKSIFIYSAIASCAVLVVAVLLIYQYKSAEKSQQLEYEAYKIYYNLYPQKSLPKQDQFQQALSLFQQSYSKKKSPRLQLYIANCYYELERYDDALKTLNEFIKKYDTAKDIAPLAYRKIAAIHLIKGNKNEALKTLDILYKSAGSIYKDFALIESGRILEKDGKKAEATAKYKELTLKFPESPFTDEAKAKLGDKKEG